MAETNRDDPPRAILLSWSSGKDSAWTLYRMQQQSPGAVVGLLTTYNSANERVAMHGVRMELVRQQAKLLDLPLWEVPLPWPCSNEIYERELSAVWNRARQAGIDAIAFGDLHLTEIRAYREQQLAGTGLRPLFPLWGPPEATQSLAAEMVTLGLRATLTCVDPRQLSSTWTGREFDQSLLDALPDSVDPCGERGEFHTFCHTGPMFPATIPVQRGEVSEHDGFAYCDLLPASG